MELEHLEGLFYKLNKCSTSEQIDIIWKKYNLTDDSFLIVEGLNDTLNPTEEINYILSHELICTYFKTTNLQFFSNKIINETKRDKHPRDYVDYSLMFDTNICSYINGIINGKSIENYKKVIPLLIEILHKEIRYDFSFYMYENSVQIKEGFTDENELWDSLNKKFKDNLLNLIRFKYIKPEDANSFKTSISDLNAEKEAKDLCSKFYIKTEDLLNKIKFKYKLEKLIILKILEIQFNDNRAHQNKFLDFVDFMNKYSFFSDRESILAIEYFKDKNHESFKKIHKGMKDENFLEIINNISWDLVAPRLMEDFIGGMSSNKKVFLPFFLSNDGNLRDTINTYPTKYVFINGDQDKRRIVSVPTMNTHEYLYKNSYHKAIKEIDDKAEERRKNMPNLQSNLDNYLTLGYENCKKALKIG